MTLGYDPAYRQLDYPGGDVPLQTGVCTDVVVRALRGQGLDLQKAVHEDMRRHFAAYPQQWGMKGTDRNIDHRRVPNLMTWFSRQGLALAPSRDASAYRAGDIVAWRLDNGLLHIGVLSDRRLEGRPLVLHNIGAGVREEDLLFRYQVIGHYRFPQLNGLGKPLQRRMSAARFLRRRRWTAGKKKPACGRFSCLPGLSGIRRGRRCPGRP